LRTKLGERVLVPNSDIAAAQVPLLGAGESPVAVPVRLGLSYSTPPDRAKRVLFDFPSDLPLVLSTPPPKILTTAFGDSAIEYECRLWTRAPWERNEITDTFLTRAHAALAREGMEIPFPQLTVHRPPKPGADDEDSRRLEALKNARLFSELPDEALETIAAHCSLARYAPGEAVVRQGEESTALFVVVSGRAVVVRDGREVSRIGPSEIFSATVRADAEALEILEISKQNLSALLERHPEVTEKLAHRLAERQLEGETLRDESGAVVKPQGLVSHLKEILSRWVGGTDDP